MELRTIPEYDDYKVDIETGDIFSYKNVKPKKLKSQKVVNRKQVYLGVSLYNNKNKKTILVHRAVWAGYKNTWNWDKPEINHIDHNTMHNHFSNLEPATRLEQMDNITRKNISNACIGKKLSDIHRKKFSECQRGDKNIHAKLIETNANEILNIYYKTKMPKIDFIKKYSKKYNVHYSTISKLVNRKTWKHLL